MEKVALPSIQDLYGEVELKSDQNQLNILLNQPPQIKWLKKHPTATKKVGGKDVPCQYIPIERVEYLLTRIFTKWRVEVKVVQLIANSVVVTVRLHYQNPLDSTWDYQDGLGAVAIQTNKDAGATDWSQVKSAGVMIGAPAAESYAVKDAAEKIGKLFGKDINRADEISYDNLNAGLPERIVLRAKVSEALGAIQDQTEHQRLVGVITEAERQKVDTAEFYQDILVKIGG